MGSTIKILGRFTFMVAMTVGLALCEHDLYNRTTLPRVIPLDNGHRDRRSTEDAGFLVGDTTPVWVAHHPGPGHVTQYALQKEEFIREAIDEWRSSKPESAYSKIVQADELPWIGQEDIDNEEDFDTTVSSAKRDLHIMVALHYPGTWPTNSRDEDQYIKNKVVYAVAFWNAIHMRLKKTLNPRLRIRIDGIIIIRTDKKLKLSELLLETYIRAMARIYLNTNTPPEVLRVMFTMTSSPRPGDKERWNLEERKLSVRPSFGRIPKQLIGVIYDDLRFDGLNEFTATKQQLIRSLGKWSTPILKPADYVQHGNPIMNPPMPGQVMTLNKQCEALGWDENNLVSPRSNWCNDLQCKNDHFLTPSSHYDDYRGAVDGTYCYKNKVCMEKQCVLKTRNTFSYADEPLNHN